MSLCAYKNVFGVPRSGIHSWRFLDTAMVDYLGTIGLAMIFTRVTKVPLVLSTILMFVLGIVLHWVFCVETNAVKFLTGS